MKQILFVCLGNICRSPLAEGLFIHHVEQNGLGARVSGDSAGTSDWHVGEPPHPGSVRAAEKLGVSLAGQRCRQVMADDFCRFDVILGMDGNNVANLKAMRPALPVAGKAEIALFMDYAGLGRRDVPDPWGKGAAAYDSVGGMIREATPLIVARLLA
ncbi:MAG: low molecular weight phosphotyrosine protein phosphatase [Nitratireductor sp.]|nr:low molecular weight phosphotyrosine protein phosphatase [Nitratireductor sp.]